MHVPEQREIILCSSNKSEDATSALNDNKFNADSLKIPRDIHDVCLHIIDILSK